MTEQSITVTKIEPAGTTPDWWRIYIIDGAYFTRNTEEVRAMGLTLPTPPLTVTIGEHTVTINRDDAAAFVDRWSGVFRVIDGNTSAMALADLIRTALEDET